MTTEPIAAIDGAIQAKPMAGLVQVLILWEGGVVERRSLEAADAIAFGAQLIDAARRAVLGDGTPDEAARNLLLAGDMKRRMDERNASAEDAD